MNITFIDHSGFLIELSDHVLLFDYYKGEIPDIPGKQWIVFASHFHQDHYNPAIFALREKYEDVRFVLSKDIYKRRKRTLQAPYELVVPHQVYDYGDFLVETYFSTDEGVAFYVEVEGKCIYHAGDLHWWHWIGEPDEDNTYMEKTFKKEMELLADHQIDVAFMLLDPRQEEAGSWGMTWFMDHIDAKVVFPMHMWGEFDLCGEYLKGDGAAFADRLCTVDHVGQRWHNVE